ncbi:hypothetical protein [Rhodoluna sp.]|uniref:hypothetical protein n=1 Tax=Rhodoluna sp. TaxID=1969481 RepID=UPI0025D37ED2|nr:hypothetical protein [Rhodoluna sp.]
MPKYEYQQHPHATARQQRGPAVSKAAKGSKLGLNERIGLGVTTRVGTMWAAYAFAALTLVSLPAALASGSAIVIVAWIAQTFLQLVLLPIIIVGQNIQAKSSDDRAIATYEDAGAILEEAKEIQVHLSAQDAELSALVKKMAALEKVIAAQVGAGKAPKAKK